jgi:hypothetical protein
LVFAGASLACGMAVLLPTIFGSSTNRSRGLVLLSAFFFHNFVGHAKMGDGLALPSGIAFAATANAALEGINDFIDKGKKGKSAYI